jgi:ribosome assembly protein RRB1
MAKRPAEEEQELEAIKNGDRPMEIDQDEVDGRPDEEREAEERESM